MISKQSKLMFVKTYGVGGGEGGTVGGGRFLGAGRRCRFGRGRGGGGGFDGGGLGRGGGHGGQGGFSVKGNLQTAVEDPHPQEEGEKEVDVPNRSGTDPNRTRRPIPWRIRSESRCR